MKTSGKPKPNIIHAKTIKTVTSVHIKEEKQQAPLANMTHKRRKRRGLPDRLDREKENKMTPPLEWSQKRKKKYILIIKI